MKTLTINILLCDTFPGLLPSYIESYTSMFQKLFNSATVDDLSLEYKVFEAFNCELPNRDDLKKEGEIYLITGCNKSVYDDIPWIKELLGWIKAAYVQGVKMVGVCFGHQAVALALGGKVERFGGGWGFGIRESDILDQKMKSVWPTQKLSLLYNHHDQVTVLPPDAQTLAQSSFCKFEGMRIGDNILTFQGHPEYIPEYERHLLVNHSFSEDEKVKQNALLSLETLKHQGSEAARFILESFV